MVRFNCFITEQDGQGDHVTQIKRFNINRFRFRRYFRVFNHRFNGFSRFRFCLGDFTLFLGNNRCWLVIGFSVCFDNRLNGFFRLNDN
uniref:Uncharacterized protein P54 n=1 Tax=Bacteriophage APSE-2 TaxID=340054 RepID=Q3LZP8_9CAUD|nr:conserved hypothetical protein [Bacteriophage APSE-2]